MLEGVYHAINRGHQRRVIFRDRRCYEDFLKRLGQFPERFGVKIHTYVLMPNHYHLQLQPALVAGMLMGSGEVVGRWKRLLAKQADGDLKGEGRCFGVVSWEDIIAAIGKEWQRPWQELRKSRGDNVPAMAIWFARDTEAGWPLNKSVNNWESAPIAQWRCRLVACSGNSPTNRS